MKITLTLDPVEDGPQTVYSTINGTAMFEAISDYAERLRQAHKYSETDADVLHAGPGYFRELLYKVLEEHNIDLEA